MRATLVLLPLLMWATPVLAQAPAVHLPPELTDPATAEHLTRSMQAISKAFLNLRVGELQAAIEGRKPTRSEERLTVRDLGRRDDPGFDRDMQQRIASARPMIEQSLKTLNEALPSMLQGLKQAQQSLERAAANMPDPNYPKR